MGEAGNGGTWSALLLLLAAGTPEARWTPLQSLPALPLEYRPGRSGRPADPRAAGRGGLSPDATPSSLRYRSDPEPPALTAPPSLPAVRAGTLSSAQRAGTVQPYRAATAGGARLIELSGILGRYFVNFPKPHRPDIRDIIEGAAVSGPSRRGAAGSGRCWLGAGRLERVPWITARSCQILEQAPEPGRQRLDVTINPIYPLRNILNSVKVAFYWIEGVQRHFH
jgi:hypothetical protein